MWYVYMLFLSNSDLYKGMTDDLRRRLNEHQQGKVKSTAKFRPMKLIHYEAHLLKSDATRREKYLKTSDGIRDTKRQLSDILKHLKLK